MSEIIYDPQTGEPLIISTDAAGNPVIVTEDNTAPWWGNYIGRGIDFAGSVFAGRDYQMPQAYQTNQFPAYRDQGATVSGAVTATPSGLAGGISLNTTTILFIALGAILLLKK